MRNHIRTILSLLVFFLGASGLVLLYIYGPQLDTKEVIVAATTIEEHQTIEAHHLKIERKPSSAIPKHAILNPEEVIGKVATGVLPEGAYIYPEWIEENGFYPKKGEILLPINSSSIFAVNLSLRARDSVYIAFFRPEQQQVTVQPPVANMIDLDQTDIPIEAADDPTVMRDVRVAAVRSTAGNMVVDTDTGKSNGRLTATETIGSIELIVSEQDAHLLKKKLEEGFTLWISRMK